MFSRFAYASGSDRAIPLDRSCQTRYRPRLDDLRTRGAVQMRATGQGSQLFDWLWFLTWGIASSIWCVTAAGQLSATFDEPCYVSRGLEHWRTGTPRQLMLLGTMPLPVDVETLPLYLWEQWRG